MPGCRSWVPRRNPSIWRRTGAPSDTAYAPLPTGNGQGALNGFTVGTGDALSTYRSSFTNTVQYRFDSLLATRSFLGSGVSLRGHY